MFSVPPCLSPQPQQPPPTPPRMTKASASSLGDRLSKHGPGRPCPREMSPVTPTERLGPAKVPLAVNPLEFLPAEILQFQVNLQGLEGAKRKLDWRT